MTQRPYTWRRADDRLGEGYVASYALAVWDNGNGYGSSRGSGRWAVEVDGKWIANVDTLDEAKALAIKTLEEQRA